MPQQAGPGCFTQGEKFTSITGSLTASDRFCFPYKRGCGPWAASVCSRCPSPVSCRPDPASPRSCPTAPKVFLPWGEGEEIVLAGVLILESLWYPLLHLSHLQDGSVFNEHTRPSILQGEILSKSTCVYAQSNPAWCQRGIPDDSSSQ